MQFCTKKLLSTMSAWGIQEIQQCLSRERQIQKEMLELSTQLGAYQSPKPVEPRRDDRAKPQSNGFEARRLFLEDTADMSAISIPMDETLRRTGADRDQVFRAVEDSRNAELELVKAELAASQVPRIQNHLHPIVFWPSGPERDEIACAVLTVRFSFVRRGKVR
jgi:hypothetical protein